MKLYIYDEETNQVVAIAEGETSRECEDKAWRYLGVDGYGATYNDNLGLLMSNDSVEILQ